MVLPGASEQLHGFHVAYGLLIQLVHEGELSAYEDVRQYFPTVGLPTSLNDLGAVATPAAFEEVALATLAAPHMANCRPVPTVESLCAAMTAVEQGLVGGTASAGR